MIITMKKQVIAVFLLSTLGGLASAQSLQPQIQDRPNILFITVEGQSLAALMRGETQAREPVLSVFGPDNFALRSQRWRYIRYADGYKKGHI
ncbi:MAG: hypothetical protein ABS34_11350 [Opitutaceae bacterium BACL24 MAG-120322-bin51]|jgi:ABC-type cobalamin transport system permease subunit|nr:MAG: hypothetical protein ABS34_11350 [Opitutaceae bacterium BACL24 MAG-120322-bin51]